MFRMYFGIGLIGHACLSIGILLYGICGKLPQSIRIKYIKSISLCESISLSAYCIISPIFIDSPPSIVVLLLGFYTINILYSVMKYDHYMNEYRNRNIETTLVNSNILESQEESEESHQTLHHQQIEPIRTIEFETHLPDISQIISCNYVQYTETKLPVVMIQPDGNIMLGKQINYLENEKV